MNGCSQTRSVAQKRVLFWGGPLLLLWSMSVAAHATPTFEANSLEPYLAGDVFRSLRQHVQTTRCVQAQSEAKRLSSQVESDAERRWALQVLLGQCWMKRMQWEKARQTWMLLPLQTYLLRDYIRMWVGDTWRKQKDVKQAIVWYLKINPSSLLYAEARLRAATLLLETGQPKDALKGIQTMPESRTQSAHWWIAVRAATAVKTPAAKKEAVRWATRIWVKAPASGEAEALRGWMRRGMIRLPLSSAQQTARAMRLNQHFLYPMTLQTLRTVRISRKDPKSLRCQFHYARGFAWFRLRKYRSAIPDLTKARLYCRGDKYLDLRTLFFLGQAYRRLGRWRQGAVFFRELAQRFPQHYLADDAIFMIADSADRRGKKAEAQRYYQELLRRFPQGDMSFATRWRLAYQSYRYRQWPQATQQLREIYHNYPKSRHAPAALYYAARSLQEQGGQQRKQQAVHLYRRLVQNHPLHYYSFLALSRLQKLTRKSWILERCTWQQTGQGLQCVKQTQKKRRNSGWVEVLPWGPVPIAPPTTAQMLQLYSGQSASFLTHPRYLRGRMLYRIGLKGDAANEWSGLISCQALGHTTPRRGGCGKRGDQGAELLGLHFYLTGVYHLTDRVYRGKGIIAGKLPFSTENLRSWYLAYPRPFWSHVEEASQRDKVEWPVVYGIMREESTFRADIQSRSNAYGLMQLLLSTARHAAESIPLQRTIEPADLFLPEYNISLGVRHLRFLHKQFQGQLPLMAGAYNAGSHRVKSWLERFGKYAYDRWVESINIEQTRHYVRRVSQSFAIYHFLYTPAQQRNWKPIPFSPHLPPQN